MNIITFNIRYNTPDDGVNAWSNRKEMVTELLRNYKADIFGLQEALHEQILDIEHALPEYSWVGVGREDGKKGGEFCPVFFIKSDFTILNSGTYWLSEIPGIPGKGWDAAFNRVLTWVHFQSRVTGKQFFMFNTHFDHEGMEAQKKSAEFICKKTNEMTEKTNLPVIITGDFNLTPDTEPIKKLKQHVTDSREVSKELPHGPVGTFTGFKLNADLSSKRIDYVFVHGAIDVMKYKTLTDFRDNRFPSDHLPVFVKVQLK